MYGSFARWLLRALGWMVGLCGLVLLLWLGTSTLLMVPASAAPARPTQTGSPRDVQTVLQSGAPPPPSKPSKPSSRPAGPPAVGKAPSANPGGASPKGSAEQRVQPARRPAPGQPTEGAPAAPTAPKAPSPLRSLGYAVVDKGRQLGGKMLDSGRAVVDRYRQWKQDRDQARQQWSALRPEQKRAELHKEIATGKTQELGVATPLAAAARVGAKYAPEAVRAVGKYAPRLAEDGSKVINRAAGQVRNAVAATGRALRDRVIVPAAGAMKNAATTVGRDLGDKITATRDGLRHPLRSADTLRREATEKVSAAVRNIRSDPKAALKRWPGYAANRFKKFATRTAALGAAEYGIEKALGDPVAGKGSHSVGAALYAGPGAGATRTRFTNRTGRSMEAVTVEGGVGHSVSASDSFNGRPPAAGTGLAAGGTVQWHGTGVNVEAKLKPDGGSLSARMQFMGFRGVGVELGCRSWRPSSCSAGFVTPSQFEQEVAHAPPHSGSAPSISYKIAATHTVHRPLDATGKGRAADGPD